MTPSQLFNAAFEQHQAGNLAAAEPLYREALAQDPQNADAWHLLGALCLQAGRHREALELITRAIALEPNKADYYGHRGAAHSALGNHEDAIANLRWAVQLAPQSAGMHYNLGTALRNKGDREGAVNSFRQAIALNPNAAEAHYNLGNTLRELKRLDEAETAYRDALRIRPNYIKAMVNLGNVLRALERADEAVELLRSVVAIDPDYPNAELNLGTALRDQGKLDEAHQRLRRAVGLQPQSAEAHNNLGTVLQALSRFAEARACYEEALKLDLEFPDAHFGRALDKLRNGEIEAGFDEYEWRWKCSGFSERPFDQPKWNGGNLEGCTILLYAEQGLGDTLQFARYAAAVKARGGRVIVECQEALLKLLATTPGIDQLVALYAPLPAFDVHAPLVSLPGILKLNLATLYDRPYLFAKPRLVDQWRERLSKEGGPRVGICWQGNKKYVFDWQRSIPLQQFARLARVPGVKLISLQKGVGAEQIAEAPFEVIDLSSQLDESEGRFMDTAAVIQNLDLVITSDTSIAHLAGGMGAKVWVALGTHTDWRWMLDRQDTPWYPTMRLFRQGAEGDWESVFEEIAEALHEFVRKAASG